MRKVQESSLYLIHDKTLSLDYIIKGDLMKRLEIRRLLLYFFIVLFIPTMVVAWGENGSSTWGTSSETLKPVNLVLPKALIKIPDGIQRKFHGIADRPVKVYSIDLDSDGKDDYIVIGMADGEKQPKLTGLPENINNEDTSLVKYYFVDFGFNIRYKHDWLPTYYGFDYLWFAKLGSGPMLYLFDLEGDEDNSDYKLKMLDAKTWEPVEIAVLSPLIKVEKGYDKNRIRWGYPWDIEDLMVKTEKGKVLIYSAIFFPGKDDEILKDSDFDKNDEYGMCFVLFRGTPTQYTDSSGDYKRMSWHTIEELQKAAEAYKKKYYENRE